MNVLVTGANGQLGQILMSVSGEIGMNFIFTSLHQGNGVLELNLLDSNAVFRFIEENQIDAVVNCAGYTAVDRAESDRERCFEINASGPGCLASAIKERNGILIHLSTDYVFGNEHVAVPLTEQDKVSPLNTYGQSKVAGERAVVSSGCDYVILRTSWLYSLAGHNFLKTILAKSKTEPQLKVVFDQVGSPTFALDLAKVILTVLEDYASERADVGTSLNVTSQASDKGSDRRPYSKNGVYNYSGEGICSWYDFAKAICDISGANSKVTPCRSTEFKTAAVRPSYSVLDKTKIKTVFGVEVPYWRDSLMRCLAGCVETLQ